MGAFRDVQPSCSADERTQHRPHLWQRATTVTGRLHPAEIQSTVRHHFGEIRQCYDEGFARNAQLSGRLTVHFRIRSSGGVDMLDDINRTLNDDHVAHCVFQLFERTPFPKPYGGNVEVAYPFDLTPC